MPFINCKVELKIKWTNYCVLSAAVADNADANSNNIIFTIKDTKLLVLVVTLSVKDNQKLSKPLSKRSERPLYWNKYKGKSEMKETTNEYRYFLEPNRLFVLIRRNQDKNAKKQKVERTFMTNPLIKKVNNRAR